MPLDNQIQPKILLLNGPNLNLLGEREPHIYGAASLKTIADRLTQTAATYNIVLMNFQSNSEGALIDRIHQARNEHIEWILFNPGAYTHTSIALRDAIQGARIPMIEIHISKVFQREAFRHHSYFADIAWARLVGMGMLGYDYALAAAIAAIKN